jgi:hypothetical protein
MDKATSSDRLVGPPPPDGRAYAMTEEERSALVEVIECHEAAARALRQPWEALTGRQADVLATPVAGSAATQMHRRGITFSTVRRRGWPAGRRRWPPQSTLTV